MSIKEKEPRSKGEAGTKRPYRWKPGLVWANKDAPLKAVGKMKPTHLWKGMESVRLKTKGTAQRQCTLVGTGVSVGILVNNFESTEPAP